jgi:uncharacterized protein YfkK (UPF0435 family)
MSESYGTVPELFFLKYKGIPSPWEIISQAKRFGFKCKKYANWTEVHATSNSKELLKTVGDSLIDTEAFDTLRYSELSQIWERVQRWAKDKDGFSLEPDLLPEYEKIARLVDVGAKNPNVVDLMIGEFGFVCDSIDIDDRWTVFLAICICNFFESKKRYQHVLNYFEDFEKSKIDPILFTESITILITIMYEKMGIDILKSSSKQVIPFFVTQIGLISIPKEIRRDQAPKALSLPKIWIEKYDGTQLELVKFQYSGGDIFVRINRANRVFINTSELGKLLSSDAYWDLVGKSIETNLSQIDEIQDFYNTFARHLRAIT